MAAAGQRKSHGPQQGCQVERRSEGLAPGGETAGPVPKPVLSCTCADDRGARGRGEGQGDANGRRRDVSGNKCLGVVSCMGGLS